MMLPHIKHLARDSESNVTFEVMAYRSLSRVEVVEAVRAFRAQPKVRRRRKPLRDATITILTLYGASSGM
jgi:hypothetical protein